VTEADTDGTVAAVLIMTAGAGPGARAEADKKPGVGMVEGAVEGAADPEGAL